MTEMKWVFGKAALFLAAYTVSAAAAAHAHDVLHEITRSHAVVVKVGYDTGEAMRYAEVTIFSPRDKKIEFQNGRTDANGSFAFLPDMPGEWKIVVNDGTGHGLSTTFSVDKTMNAQISPGMFARLKKLLIGISVLFGISGILYYFRARRILRL